MQVQLVPRGTQEPLSREKGERKDLQERTVVLDLQVMQLDYEFFNILN
jgi:hypothetical protein